MCTGGKCVLCVSSCCHCFCLSFFVCAHVVVFSYLEMPCARDPCTSRCGYCCWVAPSKYYLDFFDDLFPSGTMNMSRVSCARIYFSCSPKVALVAKDITFNDNTI